MIWWIVLLRAVVGAGFVVTTSIVAELLGPFWGGLLVSLPVSAGPAFVMLGLDQDDAFIAQAGVGGLVANAITQVFIAVIVQTAPRWRAPFVFAAAVLAWFSIALIVRQFVWSPFSAVCLNILAFIIFLPLTRKALRTGTGAARPVGRRWYELPMRGVMVGVLVASVVTASSWLGATLSGMAAVFPIMLTGLALVTLPRLGGEATAALFAGIMRAMPGFGLAMLLVALTAEPLGRWAGMGTALLGQLAFSALFLLAHRTRAK